MRIALLQRPPGGPDVVANLAALAEAAALAARSMADLLLCPEMFLTGYAIGGATASELAEEADGQSAVAIGRIARAYGIAIVYGYPERAGDVIHNSCNFVDRDGQLLGGYRKTHLFGELDRSMFTAGNTMSPLIRYRGWNIGLLICYDLEFPEMARSLALAGADLICVPTANMIEFDIVPMTIVPARAYENQLYVAYANYCGRDEHFVYGGLSSTIGPGGESLGTVDRVEGLVLCDLDEKVLAASRSMNPYLPSRRRDLY